MAEQRKQLISWRLKLILISGCILGLALGIFSYHVERMDDSSNWAAPISWTFKAKSRSIPEFFRVDNGRAADSIGDSSPPTIDQLIPKETEFALFALG